MPVLTIVFGLLIALVSGGTWVASGSPTGLSQLSPVFVAAGGLLLAGLGALALAGEGVRKHAMHLAAALGLLGFLAAAGRFIAAAAEGKDLTQLGPLSVAAVAVLCGVFEGLCVKSFIDARRARKRKADAAQPPIPGT
jgi:hypothetical protein